MVTLSISLPDSSIPNSKNSDKNYYLPYDEVAPKLPESDIVDDEGTQIHPTLMEDILMNSEVFITQGEDLGLAKVIRRYVDSDGEVIVNHNEFRCLAPLRMM